ncbi:MAG: NAD-dependent protein deacylase [Bdellovibrionaceae bacterium]|nr:NAD-dependent protein deacylase [Pseudobdellovibrionaceae bacterium]
MSFIPRVVVLSGAGISAESGIKTFRDNNGLWENHSVEEVATPEAFHRDPRLVHRFYNLRRQQLTNGSVEPNKAHLDLAKFEQEWPGEFLLVTQNVDNLHEAAGSENVIHMHGELLKVRDINTGKIQTWEEDIDPGKQPTLRPHIVWFGEIPLMLDEIYRQLELCEVFISVGTSGNVYPAAGFAQVARRAERHEVNVESSQISTHFDEHWVGPASEKLPELLDHLRHRFMT